MAPHRNHVEARSSRKPARQYISETHDHKPDAPISSSRKREAVARVVTYLEHIITRGIVPDDIELSLRIHANDLCNAFDMATIAER